jgi:P27 family predicted phage terminase small subunit
MARGRKPKPTAQKRAQGNPGKRRLNDAEPQPRAGAWTVPAHLPPVARAKFCELAEMLGRTNVMTEADSDALAIYAECWVRYVALAKTVETQGPIIEAINSAGLPVNKLNPALTALHGEVERLRAIGSDFGLSPVARSRIAVSPGGPDPLRDLLMSDDPTSAKRAGNGR